MIQGPSTKMPSQDEGSFCNILTLSPIIVNPSAETSVAQIGVYVSGGFRPLPSSFHITYDLFLA